MPAVILGMPKLIFYISTILCLWAIYRALPFLYFQKLKTMKNGNLETFKNKLGDTYQYKTLYNGLIRCKWHKGWVVIKANFDEEGNLISNHIVPYNFLGLRAEILFTGRMGKGSVS